MKEIGFMLVEIHGQHDKSGLLDSSTHLDVLDSWAGIKDSVSEIRLSSNNLKKISKELESSIVNLERMRNEKANIEQNLAEIDNLNLAEGEEDRLLEKRNFLSSMEKISSSINQVNNNLLGSDEYGSVKDRIESAKKTLMSIYKLAGERLNNLKIALDRASIEMSEVEVELKNSNSMLSYDSNDLEKVESRIYELRKIYRKHFLNNHDDLKDFKQKLKKKLKSIEENSNLIEELSHTKEQFEKDYITKAKNISKMRNKAALELSNAINKELPYLKLSDATFRVNIELIDENIYGTKGFDKVLFEIEANKGNGFGPISKIASGGELSRIMLALKASLLKSNDTSKNKRTMIFDEVDSGVGGAVAHAVGQRLLKIGNNQQVLAVTHQPQVAARANHHLKVDKINEKSFIKTIVKPLDDNERREELARMLSGAKITDAARKAAISLVDQV